MELIAKRMGRFMKAIGKRMKFREMGSKFLLMDRLMKGLSSKVFEMDKGSTFPVKAISMRGPSQMMSLMVKGNLRTKMERFIQEGF